MCWLDCSPSFTSHRHSAPLSTMYRLTTLLAATLTVFSGFGVLAQNMMTLSYDNTYDNAALSLNTVACSDGANGLESKSPTYTTLGSLPPFPNVGGVFTVTGYNSTACGTCYAVTYGSTTINVLAVDASKTGFTVSQEAMNNLTGGHAVEYGRVYVSFMEVPASTCGL
ncbi:immunomodulatory protein [Boletus edulis]|nr:immunomodulatory protein [Boletus edulis]